MALGLFSSGLFCFTMIETERKLVLALKKMKMLFIASDASGIAESGHSNDDPGNLYLRQLLFLLNWLHSQEGYFFPI